MGRCHVAGKICWEKRYCVHSRKIGAAAQWERWHTAGFSCYCSMSLYNLHESLTHRDRDRGGGRVCDTLLSDPG